MDNWTDRHEALARLAERQLFFVGGAPRSGTTWLQQILDCHPDVCCRGEGLFSHNFATPLEKLMADRCEALDAKNKQNFRHTGGYPLPTPDDTEFLIRTAILLGFRRQTNGQSYLAIGEKTPENVFTFPRLKRIFPISKFVGIVRDPRDLLTSAWHFFRKPVATGDDAAAKFEFIRGAIPSLQQGAQAMIALVKDYPDDTMVVTYEALRREGEPIVAGLFRFLGVSDHAETVRDCLMRTDFATQTGGRAAGMAKNGSFLRSGTVGDWGSTLSPEMNELILRELGWMFTQYGWKV